MASVRHLGLFPFCVNNFTGWSKEAAFAAFWRVKSWVVTSSSGNEYVPPSGLILKYKAISENNGASISVPDLDETSLVCSGGGIEFRNVWLAETFIFGEETYDLYEVLTLGVYSDGARAQMSVYQSINEIGGGVNFESDEGSLGSLAGSCVVRFNDAVGNQQTVEFPLYNRFAEETGTLNLEIDAEEYWGYDPGDGNGPIYSDTTGKQLRSFPN